jgi:hypothetical protein
MVDEGRAAAEAAIDALEEPRRSQMRHLHRVILGALPGIDVGVWDYSGKLIGYGAYDYSNSKGPAGRWFSIGIANRKAYVSLYAMGEAASGGTLVEEAKRRIPALKTGRGCINLPRPELLDDETVRYLARASWAQYKDGFHRPERTKAT